VEDFLATKVCQGKKKKKKKKTSLLRIEKLISTDDKIFIFSQFLFLFSFLLFGLKKKKPRSRQLAGCIHVCKDLLHHSSCN
jgi:hypothetical protein